MKNEYRLERLCHCAYVLGLISGYKVSDSGGPISRRRITGIRVKGRRPYILGREQDRR